MAKRTADYPAVQGNDPDTLPEVETPAAPNLKDSDLKKCPKCGDKCTGAYKDIHGNYRCNCAGPKCGFWDSVVSLTPEAARASWQAAGGPNRE